jgi:hypothetical protein
MDEAMMGVHHHRQQGVGASAWHFIRHNLEMCMAMCLGLAVLDALFLWSAALIGYSDPLRQIPELVTLVAALNMTAPMAAWMRFRGMEWRPIAEMSATMVAEAILLIGVAWLGIIPRSSLVNWLHALMMPVMLVPILYRLDLYTGRAGHHAHAA